MNFLLCHEQIQDQCFKLARAKQQGPQVLFIWLKLKQENKKFLVAHELNLLIKNLATLAPHPSKPLLIELCGAGPGQAPSQCLDNGAEVWPHHPGQVLLCRHCPELVTKQIWVLFSLYFHNYLYNVTWSEYCSWYLHPCPQSGQWQQGVHGGGRCRLGPVTTSG